MASEGLVIFLNTVVVIIAYFYIYPKYAGANLTKLMQNDLYASIVVLTISGSLFWNSDYQFSILVTELNWFWFTLITFFLIETPFAVWYCNKHKLFERYRIKD